MWVPPSRYMGSRCILGKYSPDPGIWSKFLLFWCFSNNTHLLAHSSIDQKARRAPLRSMLRVPPGWNPDVLSGGLVLRLMERIASGLILAIGRIQLLVVVRLTSPFSCSRSASTFSQLGEATHIPSQVAASIFTPATSWIFLSLGIPLPSCSTSNQRTFTQLITWPTPSLLRRAHWSWVWMLGQCQIAIKHF